MHNAGSCRVDLLQDVEAITSLIPVAPRVPRSVRGEAKRELASAAVIEEQRFQSGPEKYKAVPDVRTPRLRLQPVSDRNPDVGGGRTQARLNPKSFLQVIRRQGGFILGSRDGLSLARRAGPS